MTISGFTMVRNGAKLYYPIKQAIASILPICDEFVVALGDCDPDDTTLQEIQSIGSDKIKIIHTVWDLEKFPRGWNTRTRPISPSRPAPETGCSMSRATR
ncbi:hypothetical protein ACQ86N_01455 [Puia sp. P3]|uniref:hypothetical protein n=1 Tax=Puia sp. P3 TaxID=3423952 RepID=UPI003D673647